MTCAVCPMGSFSNASGESRSPCMTCHCFVSPRYLAGLTVAAGGTRQGAARVWRAALAHIPTAQVVQTCSRSTIIAGISMLAISSFAHASRRVCKKRSRAVNVADVSNLLDCVCAGHSARRRARQIRSPNSRQGALTSGEVWQEAADVCHAMSGLSATNQIALPS